VELIKTFLVNNKDWLKANWRLVALATLLVFGVRFSVQTGQPGQPPEVILILPDDAAPLVVGNVVGDDPHQAGEWILVTRVAIKAAVAILERRAPKTPSEWDDRLLAVLRLIQSDRAAFEAAEQAVHGHAVEKIESKRMLAGTRR
jgi:hypothetical protein